MGNFNIYSWCRDMLDHYANTYFLKYLLVGGINAVFTCLVYTGAFLILKLHYLAALSLAWILGNILTYIINFIWVFKPEKQLRFQSRFPKYVLSNLAIFLLNIFLLYSMVSITHYDPIYIQFGIIPFVILANYIATKLWSMKMAMKDKPY